MEDLAEHVEIHEVLRELSKTLERSGLCGQNLVDHEEIHEVFVAGVKIWM